MCTSIAVAIDSQRLGPPSQKTQKIYHKTQTLSFEERFKNAFLLSMALLFLSYRRLGTLH